MFNGLMNNLIGVCGQLKGEQPLWNRLVLHIVCMANPWMLCHYMRFYWSYNSSLNDLMGLKSVCLSAGEMMVLNEKIAKHRESLS